jgi:uncharacterized protein (DUF302 family)
MIGMENIETVSRYPFDKTIDILRRSVEENGLKVVTSIDAQLNLSRAGIKIGGNQILEVFHPKLAAEVFDKDLRAGIIPPLRIYVYEDAGKTYVIAQNASDLFSKYNGLSDLGKRLDELLVSIVNSVK